MDTKEKSRTSQKKRQASGTARQRTQTVKVKATSSKTASSAARRTQTSTRRATSAGAAKKTAKTAPRRPKKNVATPDVVYTPGNSFSRNRFLLRLLTAVAVVIALTFGMSIFFRVDTVTVAGADKYTPWMIMEASGIQKGDSLLGISDARASGRITQALPYVKDARIGIKLPDTVNIVITEFDVVYSIRDESNSWWLINSEGKVMEQVDSATAGNHTQVLGVQLSSPVAGSDAVALEQSSQTPEETTEPEITLTPVQTVYASDKLSAALSILQYLESYSIIGDVVSVDVSNIGSIEMWYGDRFQVKLGDTTQLGYKIQCMKQSVVQILDRGSYHTGVLDCSFTTWPTEIGYTPFE